MAASGSTRPAVTGVILAGGRGARMGGADKGWVSWNGRFLIEHVLERLRPQVDSVVINANRNAERYGALGAAVVADGAATDASMEAYAGPLAGMLAGLRHCAGMSTAHWALVVPCDAPALPPDLAARLLAAGAPAGRAAFAVCAGRAQPVFCLLPVALLPRLDAALRGGERRPADFLRAVAACAVDFDDPAAFANLNAPADLAAPVTEPLRA